MIDGQTMTEAEALRLEVQRLSAELEETNRGVLALYAELDGRNEELRRASEYKSRFLSMISHELRTPLTSVLNLSRLLLDRADGDLTPEQEHQVTLIRNSVLSLTEMVNELLDLARIEAGKTSLRLTTWDAAEMLAGLRGVFRPVLASEAVALVFEDPEPGLRLSTDEGKVSQVLRNFVANAVKFTEHGEIRVSTTVHADEVTFSVRDTGIGISAEDCARIFEEFVQADNPRQRYVKGTGLGLTLSRRIAQLLGGSVGVESRLNVGSRFWLTIPRVHAQASSDGNPVVVDAASTETAAEGVGNG